MRTPQLVTALVVAALASGCGSRVDSLYHGGPLPGPGTPVYALASGAFSPQVTPGVDIGYYITGGGGGSFRLVWTGDALNSRQSRHLYGSLWTPGRFTSVIVGCNGSFCPLEADSFVSPVRQAPGGSRIDFDALATSGLSGLDFVVDTEPAYLQLFVDGHPRPDLVVFPAAPDGRPASAAQVPFGLTSG